MNSPNEAEETTRLKRQGSDQAIQLALESKWEEAATLNRSIVQALPNDVDAWNRLGKALLELGRFREAHDAYGRSLQLDPVNPIAKRNLERLEGLQDTEAPRREAVAKVAQDMFIEEVGKTGLTVLHNTPREILPTVTAGDEVYLKPTDDEIRVETVQGEILGSVEPKLGLRLLRLMEGGNKYAAAVKSLTDNDIELIIKETFRDPSQTRLSFPAISTGETIRPYIKESLLRLADDDDEEIDEDGEGDDWDRDQEPAEAPSGFSGFSEADSDEEDEDA
jgi:tetratricopeptide (TPR) repeat protein